MPAPRILHIGPSLPAEPASILDRARSLDFDTILFAPAGMMPAGNDAIDGPVRAAAEACKTRDLALFADLDLYALDLHHPLVEEHPDRFAVRRSGEGHVADPRHPAPGHGQALLRPLDDPEPIVSWWSAILAQYRDAGVSGFRARYPGKTGANLWRALIGEARADGGALVVIADTPGETREEIATLGDCGFDYCLSSLPWWDGRSAWLVEEHAALSTIAPVIAQVGAPDREPPATTALRRAKLAVAALTGTGLMMPKNFETPADAQDDADGLADAVRAANAAVVADGEGASRGMLRSRTGPGAPITILLRADGPDARLADGARVALINPDPTLAVEITAETETALGAFRNLEPCAGFTGEPHRLRPGEARLYRARRLPAITTHRSARDRSGQLAIKQPRIVIADIAPHIEDGYAVKRIVGEEMRIEADIFTDGHPVLAAEVLYRAEDERAWHRTRMHFVENDRWTAHFPLTRLGRHRYVIEAWIDDYGSFVSDLIKKRDAGRTLGLEVEAGRSLVQHAKDAASGAPARALAAILDAFASLDGDRRVALLIAPETIDAMHGAGTRPHRVQSAAGLVDAERREARFASWYELFPRSQTGDPSRHGTLRDVIPRLADIKAMGFDVLYMTPIHPIGRTNRKGRNNALTAEIADPGSPYAIGAVEGGHDAIHPELGTLDDFRALNRAAHEHGLELALDFAIQCSPDHPWLKEHPGWFDWRPDGTIKYAENPPKKYEDIVNVDFYRPDALPALWCALRDVVLHWVGEGVKIFRVDNPHTKPFPFWEWLIREVRSEHPDAIFLSEAFTRPKVMYRFAKLGFSQSYTYFTWRDTKQELADYLTELSRPPVSEWFRPHFFVNTPDINPYFLQTSGRPGFLIRAALATTLSGLWGMYSGFELCEAAALPEREEYRDSEKYEIKPRDFTMPGNIVAEITQLNAIRKAEPALQSHTELTFYSAFNDNILYYGKHAPGEATRILVAVNLDPHNVQECDFEAPLWEWGLGDDEALEAEDLLHGGRAVWRGKLQHMRLAPDAPYAIWRVNPAKVS